MISDQNLIDYNEEDTPINEDVLDETEEDLIDDEDMNAISGNTGDYDSFYDVDEM